MRSIRLNLPSIVVAIGLFSIVMLTGQRGAQNPTTVVTVNLARVLEQLNERSMAEADYREMRDKVTTEQKTRKDKIDSLQSQLDDLPDADPKRTDLENQIDQASLEYKYWLQFQLNQLDVEKSLLMQKIFKNICAAIKDLCDLEGYQIALFDDSQDEITLNDQSQLPRETQIKQQLLSRRVAYAANTRDITNDVIARMNNAFNARTNSGANSGANNDTSKTKP
jgi:Skp family chaperone for outer membrane proteins